MYTNDDSILLESDFLKSDDYFIKLRQLEYSRLDDSGHVYLDFTGGNLHPNCLLEKHFRFLQNGVYGNPHSNNAASQLSGGYVREAREAVLRFFNASDYQCIFTNNASAALQIVGECYPFSSASHLLLTADNHNSVNGIREYCKNKGGIHCYCPMNSDELTIKEDWLTAELAAHQDKPNKLFAFPAQSNASGIKHSLSWIKKAKDNGWDVLLDAATFVPASKLDLSEVYPDFVSLSFYKMFGYPTGLGCLLIKNSAFSKLKKPWFAGGTVSLVSVQCDGHFLLNDAQKFENGTVNYLDIPAVTNGLSFIDNIGIEKINERVTELTYFFIRQIADLRHGNGSPLIKIYGSDNIDKRGGAILMNFFDIDNRQYPYQVIENAAIEKMISFRTGCFCNPGIDEITSQIEQEHLTSYFTSRENAEYHDMTKFLEKLRGAIRVSLGIPTTTGDILRFISFAEEFIDKKVSPMSSPGWS